MSLVSVYVALISCIPITIWKIEACNNIQYNIYFFSQQTLKAWQTVFLISAGIYGVTGTFFMFTASAEIQPWNSDETGKFVLRKSLSVLYTCSKVEKFISSL